MNSNRLVASSSLVSILALSLLVWRMQQPPPRPRPPATSAAPATRPFAPPFRIALQSVETDLLRGIEGLEAIAAVFAPQEPATYVIAYYVARRPELIGDKLRQGVQVAWRQIRPQLAPGSPPTVHLIVLGERPATIDAALPMPGDDNVLVHAVVECPTEGGAWPDAVGPWR